MDKTLTFIVCRYSEEMKFVQEAELVLLEGLGNNILEHFGKNESI